MFKSCVGVSCPDALCLSVLYLKHTSEIEEDIKILKTKCPVFKSSVGVPCPDALCLSVLYLSVSCLSALCLSVLCPSAWPSVMCLIILCWSAFSLSVLFLSVKDLSVQCPSFGDWVTCAGEAFAQVLCFEIPMPKCPWLSVSALCPSVLLSVWVSSFGESFA